MDESTGKITDETIVGVVVTTQHRGVFFGYVATGILAGMVNDDGAARILRLSRARNILSWEAGVRGFMGLASAGPSKECRVGPAVPAFIVTDVTSVAECTPKAISAWEAEPWAR